MCLITFILSAFALEWLDYFLEDKRSESRNAYRNRIEEKAKELSKAEQGSPEYESILSELELDLSVITLRSHMSFFMLRTCRVLGLCMSS